MKRFVLAIALTGLMSVTVLAGEIPTNAPVAATTPQPPTTSSTLLTNVVLTIFTLIGR